MANKACHHPLKDFVAQPTLLVACHALATSLYILKKMISIKQFSSTSKNYFYIQKHRKVPNIRFDEKCWAVEETKCRTVYDTGA